MTPLEKAREIARTHLAPYYGHGDVIEAIRKALEEAASSAHADSFEQLNVKSLAELVERYDSKVESLTRTLHAIAITLGLEVWEDLPKGSTDAVCEAVERAVNAKVLAAFVRGQRAARVVEGVDPDELPESATEGMSEREKRIREDSDTWDYLLGVIDAIREDRDRLREMLRNEVVDHEKHHDGADHA